MFPVITGASLVSGAKSAALSAKTTKPSKASHAGLMIIEIMA